MVDHTSLTTLLNFVFVKVLCCPLVLSSPSGSEGRQASRDRFTRSCSHKVKLLALCLVHLLLHAKRILTIDLLIMTRALPR